MDAPVASSGMLIRRPVADVFDAFADPETITRFWFTESSGPLAAGARVTWTWGMYGVSTDLLVKAFEPGRRLLIAWDLGSDPSEVEWRFEPRGDHAWTTVENRGFSGTPEEQVRKALDSTGGFALVLAGAKIWLEQGIDSRFVLDRHPDARAPGWKDR